MGYVSKDFIQQGCGLTINPGLVWETVPYSVRKNIKKAEGAGVTVKRVPGSPDDIDVLRAMWYKPDDPNMPTYLSPDDYMFIAYNIDAEPIGSVILLPVGNHLFLNNLAGSDAGKKLRIQDFLLWHSVNFFKDTRFSYIDVGVSYRESLYNFFLKWKIFSYPVVFNKPDIALNLGLLPFNTNNYAGTSENDYEDNAVNLLKNLTGIQNFTFIANSQDAEAIIRQNGGEPFDATFSFPEIPKDKPCFINLPKIFSVQFGAVIFNMYIPDKEMWNKYKCLDVFKRKFVLNALMNELVNFETLKMKRDENYAYFEEKFQIEDIKPKTKNENLKSAFYFIYEQNLRFHKKLADFGISHYFEESSLEIRIPIHQNLNNSHLEYLYGIFRGVLNLCSEWTDTGTYKNYKV